MTETTREAAAAGADLLTLTYSRQPGIYFSPFDLTISATSRINYGDQGNVGIWSIPYDEAPNHRTGNSTHFFDFKNTTTGTVRSMTRKISTWECFTGFSIKQNSAVEKSLDANYKYWYRIYPYDGSVTPSSADGTALYNGGAVTFTTPKCSWPTYYDGTNSYNCMKAGSLWPDVLVSYSTAGWPDDPTYGSNNGIFQYNSTNQTTSASVNLSKGHIYYVKVRLAVDNGYSDRKDVEYGKVSTYIYYTQAPPTALPAAGTYTTPQKITLSGASSGQTIRYTTDGSNPTANSPVYTAPFLVKASTTIKAQIYNGAEAASIISTYGYTIDLPAVVAKPGAGTYWNTQAVGLSCAGGYELYYTLDGSAPTMENGAKYTAPILLTEDTKFCVQRYFDGEPVGSVTDFSYIINIPAVKADPSTGAVGQGTKITLLAAAGDAAKNDIYYTENDALPYDQWTLYTSPIELTKDTTLYAVACDKVSKRYGEKAAFVYQYSELGYILNDLAFWEGGTKIAPGVELSALAGKTLTAKANITKIIPSVQGWLVTALYNPSGRAEQIKLDKLDQIVGIASGDVVGKAIVLPADTEHYVLKTFIVHDFAQLRPIGAVVQVGEKEE